MELNDSIFEGFGSNWQWATIDYRGVARVHTWKPSFSATGRILIPLHAHNSEPREAFNMVELPEGWTPMVMLREPCAPLPATDRFGVHLPRGADLMAAADVKIDKHPLLGVVDVESRIDNPAYKVSRRTLSRCDITHAQLAELIARELNVPDGVKIGMCGYSNKDGLSLTVEWEQ